MTDILYISLIGIIAYLMGSIPTGVWISKIFFGFDIREKGSKSTGSTNIFRILGKKWGIAVQLIDILKGYIPAGVFAVILGSGIQLFDFSDGMSLTILKLFAGILAILGHVFPIFASFKGGKGVNTSTGMLLALMPTEALLAILVFILTAILSGYVSLGSLFAVITIPVSLLIRHFILKSDIQGFELLIGFGIILTVAIFVTHKSNIKRLIKGEESRFDNIRIFHKTSNKNK